MNLSTFKIYLKRIIVNRRKLIPIVVGAVVLPITLILLSQAQDIRNRASDDTPQLKEENISHASLVDKGEKVINFNISSLDSSLLTLPTPDDNGVAEVLKKPPRIPKSTKTPPGLLKKIDDEKFSRLIPLNFNEKSTLKDKIDEEKDERGNQLSHYRYTQNINGIPVFNADLLIHVRNKSDIYAMSGNLVHDESIPEQKIDLKKAEEIALSEAQNAYPFKETPKIESKNNVIFNGKLVGINDDENNHLAALLIISGKSDDSFSYKYIVDLVDGTILYTESLILEINRTVHDCITGYCYQTGTEGRPPSSGDSLNAFSNVGLAYNFFYNNFGRNGYNNSDGQLINYVNKSNLAKQASWDGIAFNFGSGMATSDITTHEYTHAVTQYSAGLSYSYQSGAINESLSDIFGSSIDNNWSMGEGSTVGTFRDMSNPPAFSQPDRLFSGYYYCGSNDYGGVHYNSGIANKAYYLVVSGGNFNNCSISGIGRNNANRIFYRALTYYLSSSSNYYSLYAAIINSCNDLYGSTSSTCLEVKKALESVEMDQQPIGYQSGGLCLGMTAKAPQCASGYTNPTPTISNPTPTPAYSAATLKSPLPGSKLTSSSVTFSWDPVYGASSYYIYLGSTGAGSYNLYSSYSTQTYKTISTIPTTQTTLYFRLWTYFNNLGWKYRDFTYTTGSSTSSLTPTPTSPLSSTSTYCDGGLSNCADATGSNYSCTGTKVYAGNTSKDYWCKTNGGAGSREYCWRCNISTATPTPTRYLTPTPTTSSCTKVCYRDADGDGYGTGSNYMTNQCTCNYGWATNASDCYDSNSAVNPAQTGYFGVQRGDGSFDYNCNGATEKKYPKHSFGYAATSTCLSYPPSGTVNFTNDNSCGVYGSFRLCFRWTSTACGGTSTANASSQSTGQACPSYVAGNGWALVDAGSVQQHCK